MAPLAVARTTTHVMSCDASVVVTAPASGGDPEPLATWALARLRQLEQRWSRFLPTSEISRLNAAGGAVCRVSADTVRLVESLVRAWHATGGAFDPTLLVTLVELGYAASRDDATLRTSLPSGCRRAGRPEAILVDAARCGGPTPRRNDPRSGRPRQGVGGRHRDRGAAVGRCLGRRWWRSAAICASPASRRQATDGRIGIRPAVDGEPQRFVQLAAGGVATSSSRLRTWRRRGRAYHHLIDPRTRTSTSTDVVSCTVIAGTAAWAEAFTKVGFAAGLDSALGMFAAHSLAASITTERGAHHLSERWKDFCP